MNNKRKLLYIGQISKQLRSKLPRRKRQHFSPVLFHSENVGKTFPAPVELSDCSCVLTNSGIEISTKNKRNEAKVAETEGSSKLTEGTSNLAESTIASIDSVRFNCVENDECEVESGVKKPSVRKSFPENIITEIEDSSKLTQGTSNLAESTIVSLESVRFNFVENEECEVESGVKKSPVNLLKNDVVSSFPEFELECLENFTKDNFVISSEEECYNNLYSSSVDLESSEFDSLTEDDFTPSDWYESGSQFSEKSSIDDSPSRTFQLLKQFSQQFYRSSLLEKTNYYSDDVTLLGLENEEDEENYRMLKRRERRQFYLRDYAAEYCSTDYGQLIVEQRLEMIHWIFEHSTNMELQSETMFLGINLLDRFFSKGYFKTKTSLQLAGIACLTLATRIEENQPYNSIRKKTFYVGNTAYSRCEVVAMEWLVQEVLNFQCFLPTIYNFLWFYLKAARANDTVGKTVGYLATLAMLSHEQMCFWPSTVAASLVILACKEAESDAHCHLLIESHSREKDDTLPECMKRLEWLVKYF